jgi:hypothetical protein
LRLAVFAACLLGWDFGFGGSAVHVTLSKPATLLFAGRDQTFSLSFSPGATDFLVQSAQVPGLPGDELLYAQATTPRADGVTMELGLVSRWGGTVRPLLPQPLVLAFPELEAVCVDKREEAAVVVLVLERDPDDGIPCICWPHRVRMTRYRVASDLLKAEKPIVTDRVYKSAIEAAHAAGVRCDLNLLDLETHARLARPRADLLRAVPRKKGGDPQGSLSLENRSVERDQNPLRSHAREPRPFVPQGGLGGGTD